MPDIKEETEARISEICADVFDDEPSIYVTMHEDKIRDIVILHCGLKIAGNSGSLDRLCSSLDDVEKWTVYQSATVDHHYHVYQDIAVSKSLKRACKFVKDNAEC